MNKDQAKALKAALKKRHPFCPTCGWAMGGQDSWDGFACNCGHTSLPFRVCGTCQSIGWIPVGLGNDVCHKCMGTGLL